MKQFNIMICGLGGTGVTGVSYLLKSAAQSVGIQVAGAETRGSSQRGGVVTSSVRYLMREENETNGELIAFWPGSIPVGGADLMIATEASESLRNALYLNETTTVILNSFIMPPKPSRRVNAEKGSSLPSLEEVAGNLGKITQHIYVVDGSGMSMKTYGSYRMTNFILLGAALAHGHIPIAEDALLSLLTEQEMEAVKIGGQSLLFYSKQSVG